VKRVRVLPEIEEQAKDSYVDQSDIFVFYNKKTGVAQFRAEALAGERESIERAAGLLAIQCLMRGHDPNNFTVLVEAPNEISNRLVARAQELLEEGRAIAGPAPLSPRQKEILHSVVRHEANKEIASRLNITVRTVKFHISSLLNKFDVQSRGELARKAAGILGVPDHTAAEEVAEDSRPGPMRELMAAADVRSDRSGQTLEFLPRRARTA
jgi:DNA-binding CsgD family transcriptional regulator